MFEDNYVDQLVTADPDMTRAAALDTLKSLYNGDWEDNEAIAEFYEKETTAVQEKVKAVKAAAVQKQMDALKKELESLEFM